MRWLLQRLAYWIARVGYALAALGHRIDRDAAALAYESQWGESFQVFVKRLQHEGYAAGMREAHGMVTDALTRPLDEKAP